MDKINRQDGRIYLEKEYLTPGQLEEALKEQAQKEEPLETILLRRGWVTLKDLECLWGGNKAKPGKFDLSNYVIDPEAIKLIPEDIVSIYKIIPVSRKGDILIVAMLNINDHSLIHELTHITGLKIQPILAQERDIRILYNQCYKLGSRVRKLVSSVKEIDFQLKAEKAGEEELVIKLVNEIIADAVGNNASDIHIEPEEKHIGIRLRIDGVLRHYVFLPKYLELGVVSRIKIMANLDIAEKRMPQDGRVIVKVNNQEYDYRISTCPTIYGENVVLRILNKTMVRLGLENLGFAPQDLDKFVELLKHPNGIILVTGPTSSGKTTTLYAVLDRINREDINTMTVEDPVEYQFPRIRQVQFNPKAGLTFAAVLRSFLRQDPDVLLVGEIRDSETADIAVRAALTGHLVFSTLHTNDAVSAFTRLINMHIEQFLLADSVRGILSQRLVRKICPDCKEAYNPSESLLKVLNLEEKNSANIKFYRGKGCVKCNDTGYKGRTAIFELLIVTPQIRDLIINHASSDEIRELAKKQGMKTLRERGISKLLAGITTFEEVLATTQLY